MRRQSPMMSEALRTIAVANMILVTIIGGLLVCAMDAPARFVAGALCAAAATTLAIVAHHLDPYRTTARARAGAGPRLSRSRSRTSRRADR